MALEHYRTLLGLMGVAQGLRHARKHLAAYAAYVRSPDAAGLRRRLVVSENSAEVKSLLVSLFESEERAVAA